MEYRLRLRVLCEDFALVGRPKTWKEVFMLWKRGLRYTMWENLIEYVSHDPIRDRRWTDLEVMYIVERVMSYWGEGPMIREATFILKNDGNPTHPEFGVWSSVGPWYVYAHDNLTDHHDWIAAESDGRIHWIGTYLGIMPPPFGHHAHSPPAIGMQLGNESAEEEEEEEEEEEAEEEDPEEDPNWVNAEEMPPVVVGEDPNHVPTPPLMNFDQELQIPDYHRAGDEEAPDPTVWRDIHATTERLRRGNTNPEAGGNREEEPVARIGAQETVELTDEDRARLLRIWEEAGVEARRMVEQRDNRSEEAEPDEEEMARPLRRPRMSVRGYLRQFIRRDDGNPSSSQPRTSPSP